jgi:hypothetical protein
VTLLVHPWPIILCCRMQLALHVLSLVENIVSCQGFCTVLYTLWNVHVLRTLWVARVSVQCCILCEMCTLKLLGDSGFEQ